jgi:hypothetical protein
MRRLAFVPFAIVLGACSLSWSGQNARVTQEQAERGIMDVETLSARYENQKFWGGVRQRMDGRANAWGQGLMNAWSTIDRHIFNYSWTDPYVNVPASASSGTWLGRAAVMPLISVGNLFPQ